MKFGQDKEVCKKTFLPAVTFLRVTATWLRRNPDCLELMAISNAVPPWRWNSWQRRMSLETIWRTTSKPGWNIYECHESIEKVNSLWPSDAIYWQRYGSTFNQVLAYCLMAASHHLNQCWLIISGVCWHSPGSNFALSDQVTILYRPMS